MGGETFIYVGRLASYVTVIILTAVKSVNTNVLVYKAALNLKFKCVSVAVCSLVMSPFSRHLLLT